MRSNCLKAVQLQPSRPVESANRQMTGPGPLWRGAGGAAAPITALSAEYSAGAAGPTLQLENEVMMRLLFGTGRPITAAFFAICAGD